MKKYGIAYRSPFYPNHAPEVYKTTSLDRLKYSGNPKMFVRGTESRILLYVIVSE